MRKKASLMLEVMMLDFGVRACSVQYFSMLHYFPVQSVHTHRLVLT